MLKDGSFPLTLVWTKEIFYGLLIIRNSKRGQQPQEDNHTLIAFIAGPFITTYGSAHTPAVDTTDSSCAVDYQSVCPIGSPEMADSVDIVMNTLDGEIVC